MHTCKNSSATFTGSKLADSPVSIDGYDMFLLGGPAKLFQVRHSGIWLTVNAI